MFSYYLTWHTATVTLTSAFNSHKTIERETVPTDSILNSYNSQRTRPWSMKTPHPFPMISTLTCWENTRIKNGNSGCWWIPRLGPNAHCCARTRSSFLQNPRCYVDEHGCSPEVEKPSAIRFSQGLDKHQKPRPTTSIRVQLPLDGASSYARWITGWTHFRIAIRHALSEHYLYLRNSFWLV